MEITKRKTEPWTLESLDVRQMSRENEEECWSIRAGGAQQPAYKIMAGDLETAVNELVRQVTQDAIEDEAREWQNASPPTSENESHCLRMGPIKTPLLLEDPMGAASQPQPEEWGGVDLTGPWRLVNDREITGNFIPTIIDSNNVPLFSAHAYKGVLEKIIEDHERASLMHPRLMVAITAAGIRGLSIHSNELNLPNQ